MRSGNRGGVPQISLVDVERARVILGPVIERTPLLCAHALADVASARLYLKAENLQRTGSFKIRGAFVCLSRRVADGFRGGVVAASAGNHAQGVAFAARQLGLEATIVMPRGASLAKAVATEALGAHVMLEGDTFDDALEGAHRIAAERGLQLISAFDDPEIIAGQGTVGLEILDDLPEVGSVVVPVGGGGLITGIAIAVKAIRPRARVIGVQSSAVPSYAASIAQGEPTTVPARQTIADGIAVKRLGDLPFRIMQDLVDDVVVVDDSDIVSAMALMLERSKLVVEGAGAVGLAALLSGRLGPQTEPVVLVLSGGNVDVNLVARVIHSGLTRAGRYLLMRTRIVDRPGSLRQLLDILARLGVNVLDIEHHREGLLLPVHEVEVEMTVETRDQAHCEEILLGLRQAGYAVQRETLPTPIDLALDNGTLST